MALGYSPDHRTLAVVSIGSNSVTFHRYRDECPVKHCDLCRPLARMKAVSSRPDGPGGLGHRARRELHIRTRRQVAHGEDPHHYAQRSGACRSSRPTASTATSARPSTRRRDVVSVADHKIIAKVKQESPFLPEHCRDGRTATQVWFTLKRHRQDTGVSTLARRST